MSNPNILIVKTDGINCDQEMQHAFEVAGASADIVHVNEIRAGHKKIADYAGIGLPGGFSYGDDIASGAVLANELTEYLGEELQTAVDQAKPIIGICNGFQVLARTGLLPEGHIGKRTATLAPNDVGHFVCKWVDLVSQESVCKFISDDMELVVPMQIAHGEGRFVADNEVLDEMNRRDQIVFTYSDNPNGSMWNIAGICDPSGTVLGMMPHPERSIASMHPDRMQTETARHTAQQLFANFVSYARGL